MQRLGAVVAGLDVDAERPLAARRVDQAGDDLRHGIGIVPEGRQVFPNLSVLEHLLVAASNRSGRADPWTQQKVFALLGIDEAQQKNKFGFLLDALQYGAPPHGGLALGLDRMIMILRNLTNIRDVIAFPKTQSGQDLMCQAPNTIDERQLKEVHIKVALPPAPPPKS